MFLSEIVRFKTVKILLYEMRQDFLLCLEYIDNKINQLHKGMIYVCSAIKVLNDGIMFYVRGD